MTHTRSKGKNTRSSAAEYDLRLAAVKVEPLKGKELLQFRNWGLGTLLNQDWSHLNAPLIREMVSYRDQKFVVPEHFNFRGQPAKWTPEVWAKVYYLPSPTLGGFKILKATKLETLISLGVVTPEFRCFCKVLNPIFTPQRPEYYQENLLEFSSPTEALHTQLLAQMEGLARVLLGEEVEGPQLHSSGLMARELLSRGVASKVVSEVEASAELLIVLTLELEAGIPSLRSSG
ncbi:hypothetical protein R1sor_003323 [Riccia sorocarpa]|uniref:Uncharacterized protein n=1 Tax=Riccia sorocarpa TaxID=122646 RepID=A0ABD3H5E2_9MARC